MREYSDGYDGGYRTLDPEQLGLSASIWDARATLAAIRSAERIVAAAGPIPVARVLLVSDTGASPDAGTVVGRAVFRRAPKGE